MDYISRSEWGAESVVNGEGMAAVKGVALHRAKSQVRTHEDCPKALRDQDDIYNWIVCPHGGIFEARGWSSRPSVQGRYGDSHYYAVLYLGEELTESGKQGLKRVAEESERPVVRPHSFFSRTNCPGDEVRAWIEQGLVVDETTDDDAVDTVDDEEEIVVQKEEVAVISEESATVAIDEDEDKPSFSFRYKVELSKGHRGPSVSEWQTALRDWNNEALSQGGVNGEFEEETAAWTARFMVDAGLTNEAPDDPVVDAEVRSVMEQVLSER